MLGAWTAEAPQLNLGVRRLAFLPMSMAMRVRLGVLLVILAVACGQPQRGPGLYFGPLSCPPPVVGPAHISAGVRDSVSPTGTGTLVVRFTARPGDSTLHQPGAPLLLRAATVAHSLPDDSVRNMYVAGRLVRALRRDSVRAIYIADQLDAGTYTLDARFVGWRRGPVEVVVRPGFVDTVVVPLEKDMLCPFARHAEAPPNVALQLTGLHASPLPPGRAPLTEPTPHHPSARVPAAELGR